MIRMSYENTHCDAYVELQDAEKLTDRMKVLENLIDIADQEFSFAAPLSLVVPTRITFLLSYAPRSRSSPSPNLMVFS